MGTGFTIADNYHWFVKYTFFVTGLYVAICTIIWKKLFPPNIGEADNTILFFDDTDIYRNDFEAQLKRIKGQLIEGISIQAVGYLSIQQSIHKKYLEHRANMFEPIRRKVEELYKGALEFNAFARDCKTQTRQSIEKGVKGSMEAKRIAGIFNEDFQGKVLEVSFVGMYGEERTVKAIERLLQLLNEINNFDPRKKI